MGVITTNQSIYEWRIVFWIAFVVFNVTNLVYVIWASGEVQPWNDGVPLKRTSAFERSSTSDGYGNPPMTQIEELKRDSLK